jgi:hypothetical protein
LLAGDQDEFKARCDLRRLRVHNRPVDLG